MAPRDTAAPSDDDESAGGEAAGEGGRTGGIRILAFDAGNKSGTALFDSSAADGCALTLGRVEGRNAAYDLIHETPDLTCFAYEQFVVRQGLKEIHADVIYINGAIEAEARRRRIPFYRYTPAQSKGRVSDALLKSIGWWPGFGLRTGGHAADAARILLCTLTDEYPLEELRT